MHDTAMLPGALGRDAYDRPIETITPYFASSGTGQVNAILPLWRQRATAPREHAADSLQFDPRFGAGRDMFDALVRQVDRIDPSYRN